MANEPIAQITSLVNTRSNGSEISVTRIRDVDVAASKPPRIDAAASIAQAKEASAEQMQVSRESFERVVSELESFVQNAQRNLDFQIDDKTGRVIVSVVDSTNDSVIRQIPSEEMLVLSHRIQEFMDDHQLEMKGMLLELKA